MKGCPILKTKVVNKIGDIPPDDWNAVYPKVAEGYHFFKAIDESNVESVSFYYIMVYRDGLPVGAAPCFLIDYPLETTVEGPLKNFIEKVKIFFPNFLNLKTLICGCVTCEGRIGLADREGDEVIKALLGRMGTIAEEEKAKTVAFKDIL